MSLLIIAALFGMSLFAAWVLFKFLDSYAEVTEPKYKLGGAAAGFAVFFSLLSLTYIRVDNKKKQDQIHDLTTQLTEAQAKEAEAKTCLEEQVKEVTYAGKVSPTLEDANVVLGVSAVQLQQDGEFAIKVRHVKPSDFPFIYVIGANSHAPYKQVFATDNPEKLVIPH